MSVRVCWRPIKDTGTAFRSGTSTSLSKLIEALGSHLGPSDVLALRAMSSVSGDGFYAEVANVIEQADGEIEVFGVY
jgi:hypothetical protein